MRGYALKQRAAAAPCAKPARAKRLATLLLLAASLVWAAPAGGTPQTLKRSLGNIVFAPFDMALSPIVAGLGVHRSLRRAEDPPAVRAAYLVPGFAWNTGVQAMAAVVREVAGLLELLPGLCLVALDRDLEPLYAPSEHSDALVDLDTRLLPIRFGIDYVNPPQAATSREARNDSTRL
ncbi:MAG: hypothetical protein OEM49_03505 [Myxococcales bacterium]|nr:hypothetical protein [Myxococcales bacterium]MDH5308068.1 hypothetical protein [Myxococcales bacterium]MDH5567543.1 hypothetical protein [Myxococcales bacterium]